MPRAYRLLLILFAITMISQVTFSIDVVRSLGAGYPVRPIGFGDPWPTVNDVSGPAEKAGIHKGDRVLIIEGRAPQPGDLPRIVHGKKPGEQLTVVVERG